MAEVEMNVQEDLAPQASEPLKKQDLEERLHHPGQVRLHAGDDDGIKIRDQGQAEIFTPQAKQPLYAFKDNNELEKQPILPEFLAWPMFWFPYTVESGTVRFIGGQVSLTCIAIMIARHGWGEETERGIPYVCALLAADYLMRFLGGGRCSIYGLTAAWMSHFLPEREFIPGAQKQFASLCGFSMAASASVAYFLEDKGIAGSLLIGGLWCASTLEAAFDFCLGCEMYAYFRNHPRIKAIIRKIYGFDDGLVREATRTANWALDNTDAPPPDQVVVPFVGKHNSVHLSYKKKTDEWRNEDWHLLRHCSVGYFAMPMSLAGLAIVFKLTRRGATPSSLHVPVDVWRAIANIAAVFYAAFQLCYLGKWLLYPHKVVKEFKHPVKRHAFSMIPITWLLFSYLVEDEHSNFAEGLFWMGAGLNLLLALVTVSGWVSKPTNADLFDPSAMIPPVGNLVAALVAPIIDPSYAELAWFLFSFGVLYWLILLPILFNRLFFKVPLGGNATPSYCTVIAAPAVACVAYVQLSGGWDAFARVLFFSSCTMALVAAYLLLTNYFFRAKFSMAYWGFGFPLAALAMAAWSYHAEVGSNASKNMLWISTTAAGFTNVLYFAHTINGLIRRRFLFVPEDKWGPLAFMKIIHYAFRESLIKLNRMAAGIERALEKKQDTSGLVAEFALLFEDLSLMHEQHSQHEDSIVFKAFHMMFPGHPQQSNNEHKEEQEALANLEAVVEELVKQRELSDNDSNEEKSNSGDSEPEKVRRSTHSLLDQFHSLSEALILHFEGEEFHLNPIGKKHITLEWQKRLTRSVFEHTTADKWARLLPFIIENQFIHKRRVRFIECLRWAVPERMPFIGKLLYQGVEPSIFTRLAADFPELIPRHVSGYEKVY